MAYSKKSLASYMEQCNKWFHFYAALPVEELKLCESKGNRKVGLTFNYSLAALLTCGDQCRVCQGECYDIKAALQYGNVMKARIRNTVLALLHPAEYFRQIDESLSRKRSNHPVRFHVGGDIPNYSYLCSMIELAKKHSNRFFWTYTKKYALVNRWIAENGPLPSNMVITFSKWDGLEMDNPYGLPEFFAVEKGERPEGMFHCPGNCQHCIAAKCGCVGGQSSYIEKH